MFNIKLYSAAVAVVTAAILYAPGAVAENYPDKPIKIIVSFGPGGGTDVIARKTAEKLSPLLDQDIIVENRPGGGNIIGTAIAAKSKPDGYTLFLAQSASHGVTPALHESIPYDPLGDFEPIQMLITSQNVLVVREAHPANSFQEFMAWAEGHETTFGSPGTGSVIHLSGEMFKDKTGLNMTHVPYKGSGEALPALMGGNIDMIFENLASALPLIQAGNLKALAVTGEERDPRLPDVPTVQEVGGKKLADYTTLSWWGLAAPAGIPESRRDLLSQKTAQVLADEDFQEFVEGRGGVAAKPQEPSEFRAFIKSQLALWERAVQEADVAVGQ